MKILVILEDPTHDRYIVEPVVRRILADLQVTARMDVLTDPHLRGVDDLIAQLPSIIEDNPMVDVFVVVIDRDCNRQNNVERIENATRGERRIVACCAIEEVETWMLVLHRDELGTPWPQVRAECDVKETYALPFLRRHGETGPGRGRKAAMRELGTSWRGLKDLCDEVPRMGELIRSAIRPAR